MVGDRRWGGERGGCRLVGVSGLMTHRETKPTLLGVHEKYNFIPPCELFLSFFVTLVIFILGHTAPIITQS